MPQIDSPVIVTGMMAARVAPMVLPLSIPTPSQSRPASRNQIQVGVWVRMGPIISGLSISSWISIVVSP